jgi:CRISPR-associated protein Cas2
VKPLRLSEYPRWVIAYDVVSDRRRARLARLLDGWGDRVQDSVFEAWLNEHMLQTLIPRILREIDVRQDRVSLYRVCAMSEEPIRRLGTPPDTDEKAQAVVFVV